MKLTKARVEALRAPDPTGRQNLYWDEELSGFAVLCSGSTKVKT